MENNLYILTASFFLIKCENTRSFILRDTSKNKWNRKQTLEYLIWISFNIQFPYHRKLISSPFPINDVWGNNAKEIVWGGVDWIYVLVGGNRWRSVVDTVKQLPSSTKKRNFLEYLNSFQDTETNLLHAVGYLFIYLDSNIAWCGFGGLEVACWPLVPKFAGSTPGRSRWIFQGEKILSTPSFRREVKPFVPCRIFAACKRTRMCIRGSRSFRLKLPTISLPGSSSFHY